MATAVTKFVGGGLPASNRPISRTAPPHPRNDPLHMAPGGVNERFRRGARQRPFRVRIYCNGDRHFKGKQINIAANRYATFGDLLNDLTGRLPNNVLLTYGVRQIFTPTTGRRIHDVTQLRDGGDYVCAGFETFKPMRYGNIDGPGPPEQVADTATEDPQTVYGLRSDMVFHRRYPVRHKPAFGNVPPRTTYATAPIWSSSNVGLQRPKVITIINGSAGPRPHPNVKILLNRQSVQSYESFARDVADAFSHKGRHSTDGVMNGRPPVRLFSIRGREVHGILDLFRDDDVFICVSNAHGELGIDELQEIFGDLYPGSTYGDTLVRKWERTRRRVNRHNDANLVSKSNVELVSKELMHTADETNDDSNIFKHPGGTSQANPRGKNRLSQDEIENDDEKISASRDLEDESVIRRAANASNHEAEHANHERRSDNVASVVENRASSPSSISTAQLEHDSKHTALSRIPRVRQIRKVSDNAFHLPPLAEPDKVKERPPADTSDVSHSVHRLDFDGHSLMPRQQRRHRPIHLIKLTPLPKVSSDADAPSQRKVHLEYTQRSVNDSLPTIPAEGFHKNKPLPSLAAVRELSSRNDIDQEDQTETGKTDTTGSTRSPRKVQLGNTVDGRETGRLKNGPKIARDSHDMSLSQTKNKEMDENFNIIPNIGLQGPTQENVAIVGKAREDESKEENSSRAATDQPEANTTSSRHETERTAETDRSHQKQRRYSGEVIYKTKVERQVTSLDRVLEIYEHGKVLGDGNFAVVKMCRHRLNGQDFAMKVIDKSKMYGKESMVENEIAIMKACNHVNIVRLYEEYETKAEIYLIMELVKGGDLFDTITQSVKFDEPQASRMVSDMTHALFYLHSRNIVHRDLKPENILVHRNIDNSITLKLADFGLAMEVEQPIFTICGTPTYVAPEILNQTGYGLEIDMWALGVILYILLCGFPPFRSADRKQTELFQCIKSGNFEFLSPYWDNNSKMSKQLISHLLIVNRHKRYTAADVLCDPFVLTVGGSRTLSEDINVVRKKLRTELERTSEHDIVTFKHDMMKHS